MAGDTPTKIEVIGGAFGLASNAIHFLDLAEFQNGAPLNAVVLSGLNPGSIEGKRAGCVEVFGTLTATLDNGGTLSVTCADTQAMTISITLSHGTRRIVIDELGGCQTENETTKPFTIKHVSGMPYLYDAALQTNNPSLTPYASSARQHRLYLQAMCQHLGLPQDDSTRCPVS
jgi:hypothetical protein